MPLFGKKDKDTKKSDMSKSAYPVQAGGPSTGQAGYPQATAAYPQAAQYPAAPPPYTAGAAPQQGYVPPPPGNIAYSTPMHYNTQYGAPPPQPYGIAQMPPGVQQPAQFGPGQTVVVQNGFDAGARFGTNAPSIPPPPPGCMPTAGQAAAANGANVVMTQRQGNFISGGSDGGMVIW